MKLTAVCREVGGWIDLRFRTGERELRVDAGTLTFGQVAAFIGSGGYTELEVEAVVDRPLPLARCDRVFRFIQREAEASGLRLSLSMREIGRTEPESRADRYAGGIGSFVTGVYPGVPPDVVKHMYAEFPEHLPSVQGYVRKTAINSAVIIETRETDDLEELYAAAECPNIVHFKSGGVYRLNYPEKETVEIPDSAADYLPVKESILAGRRVRLCDGQSLARTPNYFEKEGGSSINRIVLLPGGGFSPHPGRVDRKESYEIDSIELRPIPLLSRVLFDSGTFAGLCRFDSYALVPEAGEPYRFRIGNGRKVRTIDLAAGRIV